MKRFIKGEDRSQVTLLPECLDDYIGEDNPVRVVDAFVDELDLGERGFGGVTAALTGRPGYHPAISFKLYIYGYLYRIQSSWRLKRECQRNVELMWLTNRLAPDFRTIADFPKDNSKGIRNVCRRCVMLCRDLNWLTQAAVAARDAMDASGLNVSADRGYYRGPELKVCEDVGMETYVPKPITSSAKTEGRERIRRIVCGVTASQALIEAAAERRADALLVHHG